MRTAILLALLVAVAGDARAACTLTAGSFTLEVPRVGDSGTVWAACLQRNFEVISASWATSGHTIEESSTPVTQRGTLNFIGDGVDVFDSADKTFIQIDQGGHTIEGSSTPVTQRPSLNFIGPGINVYDSGGKTQVEFDVLGDVFRSTGTRLVAQTTADSEWTSVGGSTLTLVADHSTLIRIGLNCNVECLEHTACPVAFSYLLDGDFFDGGTASTTSAIMSVVTDGMNTASPEHIVIDHQTTLSVGTGLHELSLLWVSPGGVDVQIGRDMIGCSLTYAQEDATINTGSRAVVAGVENFGSQSIESLQELGCAVLPCQAQGSTSNNFDIWVATGTEPGQWMNSRTGIGPE